MEYNESSTWDIIRRFLIGWGLGLLGLAIYSCAKHWNFIITAFANNTWALVMAMMPIVFLVLAILYMIRAVFR